jgi:hypothetical protein
MRERFTVRIVLPESASGRDRRALQRQGRRTSRCSGPGLALLALRPLSVAFGGHAPHGEMIK